ncbi:unnamed protein product [Thelazia callipaeda]|uniref:Tenascin n=1 Tax=Thelazia callipaeda TaxID=103827 RepID=A0A158RCU1_THECL|nr:unnamed protein product [Thelazia callipaeda]
MVALVRSTKTAEVSDVYALRDLKDYFVNWKKFAPKNVATMDFAPLPVRDKGVSAQKINTTGFSGELCEIRSFDCQVQGCPVGQRCVIIENDISECVTDLCDPNPCQHNATCKQIKNTFECDCTNGFDGVLCGNDIDECVNSPCRNDAICVNTLGSFTCLCKDGFKGALCEEGTTCDPNPCFNGGICIVDVDGSYHCSCPPGFTSDLCENRIERECNCKSSKQICVNGVCKCPEGLMGKDCNEPMPWSCTRDGGCENGGTCVESTGGCLCEPGFTGLHCEHVLECTINGNYCVHGSCIWSANGTICKCEDGFEGKYCEENVVNVDPCLSKTCNNGKCVVKNEGNTAVCICPEGSTGEFCETIDVCATKPCLNNGECLFDSTSSSNFTCLCARGFSGLRCESVAYETECVPDCMAGEVCEQNNGTFTCAKSQVSCDDCLHSFRCIENSGNAVCICETSWTGPKCDQPIEECRQLSCPDYQICRNRITVTGRVAFCGCAPGLIGSACATNTANTFHTSSFFLHQSSDNILDSPISDYTLSFAFRTTLADTHILSTENILSELQFALSIRHGYLYGNFTGLVYRKVLPFMVNDDHWYTVVFNNTEKIVSLEVREEDFVLTRFKMKERKNMGIFWTRLGKGRSDGFKGCIRDLFINGEFINMRKSINVFGVTEGCHRSEICTPNPCQNDGICHDQWDEFLCDCKKPFLPPYCLHQTEEVTFGHKNMKSKLQLSTENNLESIKLLTNIEFLLRTNKPNGTVLYLGEKNSDDVGTFIALQSINGLLDVRSRLGGKKIFSRSIHTDKIDDNKVRSINLIRDRNNFSVSIDGVERMKFAVENRFDHPLLADTLILGSSKDLPAGVFSTSDFFKGTLQDLRVNGYLVPLTELHDHIEVGKFGVETERENILEGTVSDDICDLLKPCVNGKCFNTFNDFECVCEHSWVGKQCNERDHCALSSCGANVTCTNYEGGYVCTSPATFLSKSSAYFKLEGNKATKAFKFSEISFTVRTRSTLGHIIYLKMLNTFLSVQLINGLVSLEALINDNIKKQSANIMVNDGILHKIAVTHNGIYIDGKIANKKSLLPLLTSSLNLNENITLIIGRRNDEMLSFEGCIEDMKIGSASPVSFFNGEQAGGMLENITHFKLDKRQNIITDRCYSEELCGVTNPCKNGAICRDLWNLRECKCQPGFNGTYCETRINYCENHNCKFGICLNGITDYRCQCLPEYTGKFCDKKQDLCKLFPCLNGGHCTSKNGKYNCDCPAQFVGARCQTLKSSKCASVPCENGAKCTEINDTFECDCPLGFENTLCDAKKDFCEPNLCKNGATCLSRNDDFECLCTASYEGRLCDIQKDYCTTSPCVHGPCKTINDDFWCDCDSGWKGPHCDIDVDECIRFPCEHDGNCTNTPGSYYCTCDNYYSGDRCEIVGSCVAEPCGANANCVQQTAASHTCLCKHGYTGHYCNDVIDYCKDEPCRNGATCEKFVGGFSCLCLPGFTGETCSVDIDDCVENICENGGICIDRINGYECNCENTGYQGVYCTEDVDECALDICVHGNCTNLVGSYNCSCNTGYFGKRCQLEDPCYSNDSNQTRHDCLHGTCVNSEVITQNGLEFANYECKCEPGYGGEHCIHLVQTRKPFPLSYVAGPLTALIMAFFIIGCVLFILVIFRGRRANQGTYSPSHHEISTSRMPMNSVLKSPPEERLI